ncbi:MAG: leucyl aminopeptidase [Bryobacterales bacterium]|nr:leucyl aminopeptidase [Bryobacterales bacterium]
MEIRLESRTLNELENEAVVAVVFEGEKDQRLEEPLADLYASGEITGKSLETTLVHRPAGLKTRRLALIGGGQRGRFNPAELRKCAGAALRFLKAKSVRDIAFLLDAPFHGGEFVAAAAEGAVLGDFEPDRLKTEKKDQKRVDRVAVAVPGGEAGLETALERGRIVAESQNFTRDLANEPGNLLTPTLLAERARQLAAGQGLECEVLDRDRMRQLGMGALLGVAQGSAEPPALIVLRYRPESAAGNAHLGLIGKGVTFDTGGISIKPSENMEKMKYDMSGGAAVLGAMRALAQLKPSIPVTALVPAVENMPGSRAQRPGDIVTSLEGKTVEVLNTDAEGRLILADALTYARRLGCTHLVDAATLTGAIVVSLGHVYVGAFGNGEEFTSRVLDAASAEGEKFWRMPLDDDYKEYLKSAFADLPNIGGRWGGAVTAAMFLKEFTGSAPWVHLDIAGTAWLDDGKPYLAKGPSGVPVRTLVRLAMDWRG